jgi:hypothetical protein
VASGPAASACGFGLDRWRLAGREPYLPNPFMPHRPLFRLRWQFTGSTALQAAVPLAVPVGIEAFAAYVWISLICLFALLPLALFYPYGLAFPIAVVLLLYGNNALALIHLYRRRATFELSSRQVSSIAVECLSCPPFAINLVRKICAKSGCDEDFESAARRLLRAEQLADSRVECLRRVDEQIDYEAEGTPRMQALQSGRARFIEASQA